MSSKALNPVLQFLLGLYVKLSLLPRKERTHQKLQYGVRGLGRLQKKYPGLPLIVIAKTSVWSGSVLKKKRLDFLQGILFGF